MYDVCSLLRIPVPQGRTNFYLPCPICDDNNGRHRGHMNINLQKGVYNCPKCQTSGGIISLYSLFAGVSEKEAYGEIVEKLHFGGYSEIRPQQQKQIPQIQEQTLIGIEDRDKTYNALLDLLTLDEDHLNDLKRRGLSNAEIEAGKYKTVPMIGGSSICRKLTELGCYIAGVPGFYKKSDSWTVAAAKRGYFIPVRDPIGRIQGLQIRLDDTTDGKYRWFSSSGYESGTPSECWIHFAGWNREKPQKKIYLTEGPLKADIAHKYMSRTCFTALPGVSSLSHLDKVIGFWKKTGVENITIAFDMDYLVNPNVQSAKKNLVQVLEQNGFTTEVLTWNPFFNGIDDYLLSCCQ